MSKATHANIAKIVRQIELIETYIVVEETYRAWLMIKLVLNGLKPKHKQEGKFKKLMKEITIALGRLDHVPGLNEADVSFKRERLVLALDKNFQGRFMHLMLDSDMREDGGYTFFSPAKKKDSDSVNIRKRRPKKT